MQRLVAWSCEHQQHDGARKGKLQLDTKTNTGFGRLHRVLDYHSCS